MQEVRAKNRQLRFASESRAERVDRRAPPEKGLVSSRERWFDDFEQLHCGLSTE